jgi:nucleoside-diphosphate-sugar epimerase
VLAAMRRAGVERFACVSSSAVEPDPFRQGGAVYRRFMQPYVVDKLGKTLYDDLKRMEASVRDSELDWTIVRPSGLFEHEPVTDYSVAEDHVLGRFTSRTDLADCLLRQASERAFSRKVLAIATVAVQPSMVKLIWNEGIRKKSA